MNIRHAHEADLAEIQSIYAHHVLTGTGTFEEIPPSVEEMTERFRHGTGRGWAWLVATDATGVLGYAYYSQFRDRSAYRHAAENSVYVRQDVRGQGVGKLLVAQLIEDAQARGFRQMIAVIGNFGECRLDRRAFQPRLPHRRDAARRGGKIRALAGRGVHAARPRRGRRGRAFIG